MNSLTHSGFLRLSVLHLLLSSWWASQTAPLPCCPVAWDRHPHPCPLCACGSWPITRAGARGHLLHRVWDTRPADGGWAAVLLLFFPLYLTPTESLLCAGSWGHSPTPPMAIPPLRTPMLCWGLGYGNRSWEPCWWQGWSILEGFWGEVTCQRRDH